jgi:hypothetical protein
MKNKKLLIGIGLGIAAFGGIYLFNKKKEKEEKNLNFDGAGILMKRKKKQSLLEQESSKESLGEMIVDLVKSMKGSGVKGKADEISGQIRFNQRMKNSGYSDVSGDILSMAREMKYENRMNNTMSYYKRIVLTLGYSDLFFKAINEYFKNSLITTIGSFAKTQSFYDSYFLKQMRVLGY